LQARLWGLFMTKLKSGFPERSELAEVEITVLTDDKFAQTKTLWLADDGSLQSKSGIFVEGVAKRVTTVGARGFAHVISRLGETQAIAAGQVKAGIVEGLLRPRPAPVLPPGVTPLATPAIDATRLGIKVVTEEARKGYVADDKKSSTNYASNTISRSAKWFEFRKGEPAWMLLADVDMKGAERTLGRSLTAEQLLGALTAVCPALAASAYVLRPSTSAGLRNTITGECYRGSGGWHLWVMVKNGNDASRAHQALDIRCRCNGLGWGYISKDGGIHPRSLIDTTVGSAEHVAYEASPKLGEGLAQDTAAREPIFQEGSILDTEVEIPPLTDEEVAESNAIFAAQKAALQDEADRKGHECRMRRATAQHKRTGRPIEACMRDVETLFKEQKIPPDTLFIFDALGEYTAQDVLDDPAKFAGQRMVDPINGEDYGNRPNQALVVWPRDGKPYVRAYGHGLGNYEIISDITDWSRNAVRQRQCKFGALPPEEKALPAYHGPGHDSDDDPDPDGGGGGESAEPFDPGTEATAYDPTGGYAAAASAGDAEDDGDWKKFYRLEPGKVWPAATYANAMFALHFAAGLKTKFAYDQMTLQRMVVEPMPLFDNPQNFKPRQVTERDTRQVMEWLQVYGDLTKIGFDNVQSAITQTALKRQYHSVQDWLRSLKWDGKPRLDKWLPTYARCADTEYEQGIGCMFMIGMVDRVMNPGCKFDYVLILEGLDQGEGKSTFLGVLAGGKEYFSDNVPAIHNADIKRLSPALLGKWLIELPELSALKGASPEETKDFITRQVERYIPMFGRGGPVDEPRQCVLAGTTNKTKYLTDDTGGRRYWPVRSLMPVDTEGLQANREQLFAEAYQRYMAGEKSYPDKEWEKKWIKPQQEARFEGDNWDQPIREFAEKWVLDRVYSMRAQWEAASDEKRNEWLESKAFRLTTVMVAKTALDLVSRHQVNIWRSRKIASAMRRIGWMDKEGHRGELSFRMPLALAFLLINAKDAELELEKQMKGEKPAGDNVVEFTKTPSTYFPPLPANEPAQA
jgi:predicted P-loop ATPase